MGTHPTLMLWKRGPLAQGSEFVKAMPSRSESVTSVGLCPLADMRGLFAQLDDCAQSSRCSRPLMVTKVMEFGAIALTFAGRAARMFTMFALTIRAWGPERRAGRRTELKRFAGIEHRTA